jgi:low temperature requirement protein LtrA
MMTTETAATSRTSAVPQGATFIELFFDLVFVYAITQVTGLLLADLTWTGGTHAVLVAWLVWWAWTQFTWTLSPADTTHPAVELIVLAATAVAFFMARAVPLAFGEEPLRFLIPYLVIRVIGMALYGWIGGESDQEMRRSMGLFAAASIPAMVALVLGATMDASTRPALWALAIALDLAAGVAVRNANWRVHVSHFAERHGLFVIITLGESLIAIGVASQGLDTSLRSLGAKGLAVLVVCGLWWTYFGWFKAWLEQQVEGSEGIDLLRNSYSFLHFVIVTGMIGIAAGLEEAVAHSDAAWTAPAALALVIGSWAYVGGIASIALLVARRILWPRLGGLALFGAFAAVAVPLGLSSMFALAAIALIVIAIAIIEHSGDHGPRPDRRGDSPG